MKSVCFNVQLLVVYNTANTLSLSFFRTMFLVLETLFLMAVTISRSRTTRIPSDV